MKTLKYIAIASIAITASLSTSCKKGENDPFLSLSSRKARLSGEWTVSSSYSKSTNTSGSNTMININDFNGSVNTYTYTFNGLATSSTENKTIEFTINRDGSFSKTTVNTTDEEKYEETGIWTFAGKDKTSEYKNKEVVVFYTQKTVYTDLTDNSTSTEETTSVNFGDTYVIDQLKGKEVIFKASQSSSDNSNSNTSESTMTLTKK